MKYYVKIILQHLAMGLIIPISIVWKMQNGLTLSQAVLTESIVLLVTALADLPAGFLASKINNKRSLLLGALLHLVGMLLLAFGSSFWMFVLSAVAMGMAWAFVSGADEAYIHDDFIESKDEYKKVFATSTIVDEAATIGGMLIASACMYLQFGLRSLFIGAAGLLFIHFLYTWIVLPRSQQLPALHPEKAAKFLSRINVFDNQNVRIIVPLMIAFAVVYEAGRALWQPHMQAIGIDVATFGIIFALLKIASLGGSVFARYREFKTSDVGVIFAIMLAALLVFGTSFKVLSIVALCTYLFTENYFRIYMSSVLNKLIRTNRATVLSVGSVIRNGMGALIVASAGVVADVSIFVALVVIVIIKIPAIIYIVRLQKGNYAV